ncbi:MAG: glycosyltransferase family 4 protein [Elusimicrobia bacterium]|nr:glycosyltransferase family 4 protein [Elusimicrobiota bacterium]
MISSYPPALGGTENRAARLAEELAHAGFPVTVLTRRNSGIKPGENNSGPIILHLGPEDGGFPGNLLFYCRVFLKLLSLRKTYSVIQNFLLSTLTPLCCAAGALAGKPVFVSLGGVGARGGLRDDSGTGRFANAKTALLSLFKPFFITPNKDGLRELLKSGIPATRAKLIPNPAPTAEFTPPAPQEREQLRQELGFNGEIFLFAGRFVAEKNLPLLAEAWKIFSTAHPSARLLLAGEGPLKDSMKELVNSLGIENSVSLPGAVPNLPDYYRAADFFVLPSDTEGMSNALLEAMSCGLVPLVKDISGCAPVEDGKTGLKTPAAASPGQFAALLERAAALDPHARQKISAASARLMRESYSIEKITAQYLQLYYGA